MATLLSTGGLSAGPHRARRYKRSEASKTAPQESESPKDEGTGASSVPGGLTKIDDVVKWVKEDPTTRAQLVLDEENKKDKPRKTLVRQLEEMLSGNDDLL